MKRFNLLKKAQEKNKTLKKQLEERKTKSGVLEIKLNAWIQFVATSLNDL